MARNDYRDPAKGKFGKPGTTLPYASVDFPRRVDEKTTRKTDADGNLDFLSTHPDDATLKLISQNVDKGDNTDAVQTLVYEKVPGILLSGQVFLPNGQVATKTTQTVALDGATADSGALVMDSSVEAQNAILGVKTTLTVASVFSEANNTNTQAFTMPDEYLGVGAYRETISSVVAGTDATPTALGTGGEGVTESTAELVRIDRVRHTVKTQYGPINETLTNYERGPEGQSVTTTKSISTTSTPFSIDATTLAANVTNIGGGFFERVVKNATLFGAPEYSKEISDVVPVEFRALLPTTTTEVTTAGTAAMPPTLGTGDLSIRQQQVTVQTFRTSTTNRASTTGTISGKEWVGENGGAFIDVTRTLATGNPTAPTGLTSTFVSFTAQQLGNGQTVSTLKANSGAWPLLSGSEYMTTNRLLMRHISATTRTVTKQTVEPSATVSPTWHTIEASVAPIDSLHSSKTVTSVTEFDVLTTTARSEKYNGALATTVETIIQAGTETAPALSGGVISSEVEAIDTVRSLKRVTSVDLGGIPALTGSKFIPELNAAATVTNSKGAGLTVDSTALTLASEITVDAAGVQHKQTVALATTPPVQTDSETDPQTGQAIITTHQHNLTPSSALSSVPDAAPAGVIYKAVSHGASATFSKTIIPLPTTWYYQEVVHVRIPRVLKSFSPYQTDDPITKAVISTLVPTIFSSSGSRAVTCEVEVRYVRSYAELAGLRLTVECDFMEEEWDFPGFSGRGLTDGQTYVYQDSNTLPRTFTLPTSTPSATTWNALLGRTVIVNFHVRPYKAQYLEVYIFRGKIGPS